MNSPGPYTNLKSPRSPRQLPQLPTRSPSQLSQHFGCQSPSTPRVFEFPPEHCPETPNANFDFDDFGKINSRISGSRSSLIPDNNSCTRVERSSSFYSQHSSGTKSPRSATDSKSTVFQFCNPKKHFVKTLSYPPKTPASPTPLTPDIVGRNKSSSSCGSPQTYGHKNSNKTIENARRNSSFNLGPCNSPTTIVTASSRSPSPRTADGDVFESCSNQEAREKAYRASIEAKVLKRQERDSPQNIRERLGSLHLNKSHGCLNEVLERTRMRSSAKYVSRRSTSDLTELDIAAAAADEVETEVTILSSPRRRGSMKGGLGNICCAFFFFFHVKKNLRIKFKNFFYFL